MADLTGALLAFQANRQGNQQLLQRAHEFDQTYKLQARELELNERIASQAATLTGAQANNLNASAERTRMLAPAERALFEQQTETSRDQGGAFRDQAAGFRGQESRAQQTWQWEQENARTGLADQTAMAFDFMQGPEYDDAYRHNFLTPKIARLAGISLDDARAMPLNKQVEVLNSLRSTQNAVAAEQGLLRSLGGAATPDVLTTPIRANQAASAQSPPFGLGAATGQPTAGSDQARLQNAVDTMYSSLQEVIRQKYNGDVNAALQDSNVKTLLRGYWETNPAFRAYFGNRPLADGTDAAPVIQPFLGGANVVTLTNDQGKLAPWTVGGGRYSPGADPGVQVQGIAQMPGAGQQAASPPANNAVVAITDAELYRALELTNSAAGGIESLNDYLDGLEEATAPPPGGAFLQGQTPERKQSLAEAMARADAFGAGAELDPATRMQTRFDLAQGYGPGQAGQEQKVWNAGALPRGAPMTEADQLEQGMRVEELTRNRYESTLNYVLDNRLQELPQEWKSLGMQDQWYESLREGSPYWAGSLEETLRRDMKSTLIKPRVQQRIAKNMGWLDERGKPLPRSKWDEDMINFAYDIVLATRKSDIINRIPGQGSKVTFGDVSDEAINYVIEHEMPPKLRVKRGVME